MKIDSFVDVQIALRTAAVPLPAFDAELFMLDTEAVPIDRRIRVITYDDIEDLTEDSVERDFATAFYGQEEKADKLVLGRVAKTAIPPAFVMPDYDSTLASWQAITSGTLRFEDSDTNEVYLTGLDFSSVTSFLQVLDVLNTELAALVAPAIVGLDGAEFSIDAFDRVVVSMPSGQDDTDPTIFIGFNAAPGTAPYLLGLQANGDGIIVPGNAIETLLTAYSAIKEKTEAFYNVALEDRTGDTYTERVALAAQIEVERRQATFVDTESEAVDPAESGDLQSLLKVLGYDNSLVLYTEHSDDYPDASADGIFLPANPGTRSYGHTPLSGCLPSGSLKEDYDLSSSDIAGLEGKAGNYIARAGGFTFVHRGKTAGAKEKRLVIGKHWLETGIQADVFALDMNEDLLAFDEFTLGAIDGILKKWLDEAVERRLILSYTINLPSPEDFSDAEQASGDMVLTNAFRAIGNFEAHTFLIRGSISLS